MSGTQPHVTSLALRKQLLLAESEVNREQLINECQHLMSGTRVLADRAQSLCASVSSLASLGIAGFQTLSEFRTRRSKGKTSLISTLVNGARLGAALWKSIRS